MEKVSYDANSGSMEIIAEFEDGTKGIICFEKVDVFSLESNEDYDMSVFCPKGFFIVTLYKMKGQDIYFFPTEKNVWKIFSPIHPVCKR